MSEGPSQRHEDARRRIELAESHARSESEKAQALIDDFMRRAHEKRIAPQPLLATTLTGHTVKTDKSGWYVRKNKSIAIGTDGGYYVLTVMGTFLNRIRGVRLVSTPPPLVVGRGGRDGETGDLVEFLERILQG